MTLADSAARAPTPSQTVGPFFRFGFEWLAGGELVHRHDPQALSIVGRVLDGVGDPVPDAVVEVWQADRHGQLASEAEPGWRGFARLLTDPGGAFELVTVKPGAVPGPHGQPQAPHIDVSVFARGLLQRLMTRIYFPDEATANAADPLLARLDPSERATLVAHPGTDRLVFDIHLQGDAETVFLAW